MKMKNVVKIILFCIIFLLSINRVYKVLSWKDTAGNYYSSVESYYDLEKNTVDVVFFGSSHCYCSVDPSLLWNKWGISSFGMGISGQDFAGSYYTMKEALKNQKPKVFVLDLFASTYSGYQVDGNLYRNTLPFRYSVNAYEVVDNLVQDEEKKMDFLLRWPIVHTRYAELQRDDFRTDLPVYLGYASEFYAEPISQPDIYEGEAEPWPEEREEWLRKIIVLAEENDIELCFFVAPYQAWEGQPKLLLYAEKIAEEYGIPVLNFIKNGDEISLDPNKDYIDWGHTNYYGAQKITRYMGQFFAANYDLEDHRGDERYAVWDENSKVRKHEVQNHELAKVQNISGYLEYVSCLEDYVVVLSTAGSYQAPAVDISEYLQAVGVGEEFYAGTGGVWVFDNGKNVYQSVEADSFYHMDLQYSDMVISRAGGVNNVWLDRQNYRGTEDGLNLLVYDKVLGKVADAVGFSAPDNFAVVR